MSLVSISEKAPIALEKLKNYLLNITKYQSMQHVTNTKFFNVASR